MDVLKARVTHGFLTGGRPLFASYHAPAPGAPARNVAYVVCLPLHLELIQSYRSMVRCAEELAAAGFHVMRVDYDGTGESVGATDSDPDRVAAWLESVRRAVAAMAAIPGVESVGLVGVRIGATFALETSTQVDISHLVLWEPSAGASYSREMDILASSSPQLIPGGLVAAGYWLSQETLAELGRLNLEKMEPRGKPDVLLVYRDDRKPSARLQQHLERLGCPTTQAHLPGHKEMVVMPHKSAVPTAILAAIREWAVSRSRVASEAAAAAGPPAALAPEAIVDGLRWRPFWFGAKDHLFGVLAEPATGPKPDVPPVLLLTGGVTPRTAGNGSYVALARRLATKGHTVLRMDVASIGESGTADGAPGNGNDGFPPSIVDDARAGFERVCAATASGTKVWLLGLCSGAYPAFQVSLEDKRARGAILMNPVALQALQTLDGGDDARAPTAISRVDQVEQMQRYWQVMRSPESWKKLLSGKANLRHIADVVGARARTRLASVRERVAAKLGQAPQGLAGDIDKLLTRGVSVNVVFSEGDPGHAVVLADLGTREGELSRKGMRIEVFAGADHNFHEMSSRGVLLDWIETTICGA